MFCTEASANVFPILNSNPGALDVGSTSRFNLGKPKQKFQPCFDVVLSPYSRWEWTDKLEHEYQDDCDCVAGYI